jgi:1-acyl-sn-glycerol-3-phosphate acyltransferase
MECGYGRAGQAASARDVPIVRQAASTAGARGQRPPAPWDHRVHGWVHELLLRYFFVRWQVDGTETLPEKSICASFKPPLCYQLEISRRNSVQRS